MLIIGSGPAGYTAGIYAARAGMRPVLVSGLQKGGQLTITTDVENFPGFPEPINGGELMQRMHDQAVNVGVEIVDDQISEVDFSARPFVLISEGANSYRAESVIIATGASARWLGLENEEKFRGFGVSGCATCDGFFYRNKDVAVVGGGNTAAEEALYLAGIARSVTLVHRRDELRADKVLQERIKSNPKIIVEWDSVIDDIIGGDNPKGVTEIRVKNLKTDKYKNIAVAGVFIAIGHKPNTEIFKNAIVLDNQGYIVTVPGSCQTSVPGVFAAGDVKDSVYRQAVTAAGSGCQAFLEAQRFCRKNDYCRGGTGQLPLVSPTASASGSGRVLLGKEQPQLSSSRQSHFSSKFSIIIFFPIFSWINLLQAIKQNRTFQKVRFYIYARQKDFKEDQ